MTKLDIAILTVLIVKAVIVTTLFQIGVLT